MPARVKNKKKKIKKAYRLVKKCPHLAKGLRRLPASAVNGKTEESFPPSHQRTGHTNSLTHLYYLVNGLHDIFPRK
jgi:hypothetical protein